MKLLNTRSWKAVPGRLVLLLAAGGLLTANLSVAATTAAEKRQEAKAKAAATKEKWAKFDPLKKEYSSLLYKAKKITEQRAGFASAYGFVPRTKPSAAQTCATCPKMRAEASWQTVVVSTLEAFNKDCDRKLEKLNQDKGALETKVKQLTESITKMKAPAAQGNAAAVASLEQSKTESEKKITGLTGTANLIKELKQWINSYNT